MSASASSLVFVSIVMTWSAFGGDDPFADFAPGYEPGVNPAPGYSNPATAIGPPERFTGEGIFPSVVSPFNAPYGLDEIVSIGAGGYLVLEFATPVVDDPNNPYGIDLLIFGNTGFIDSDYDNGIVGGLFSNDGGTIEVSDDGSNWHLIPRLVADGPMPTTGYLDSGPYDTQPGAQLTDFTRPVDPHLDSTHMLGMNLDAVRSLYRGSGGGVGVDLAVTPLSSARFVRIANPTDAVDNIEIDAASDVAPRLPGDVNLDQSVNVSDLLALIGAWGVPAPGAPPADFNLDGVVNVSDLLILIGNWSS